MKQKRQSTVAETFQKAASGIGVRQSVVDMKIVDLFVYNMLPLQVVDYFFILTACVYES